MAADLSGPPPPWMDQMYRAPKTATTAAAAAMSYRRRVQLMLPAISAPIVEWPLAAAEPLPARSRTLGRSRSTGTGVGAVGPRERRFPRRSRADRGRPGAPESGTANRA